MDSKIGNDREGYARAQFVSLRNAFKMWEKMFGHGRIYDEALFTLVEN